VNICANLPVHALEKKDIHLDWGP